MVPDTAYFAAMLDAGVHGQTFVDPDQQRGGTTFYSVISFVASGTCDSDGLVRFNGLPALPWIVTAAVPQKIPGSDGNRIVVHTILQANATTTVPFSQKDIVAPSDTVSAGFQFNAAAIREAFSNLPRTDTAEGAAVQAALTALDRGDSKGLVDALVEYGDACRNNGRCPPELPAKLRAARETAKRWIDVFALLVPVLDEIKVAAMAARATTATMEVDRLYDAAQVTAETVGDGQAFRGSTPLKAPGFAEVSTPQEIAAQSIAPEALAARVKVEQGATLYRIGTMGRSDAAEAQYWALENPMNPGYAERYGIPPSNVVKPDFVETATLKPGTPFITRPAPGVGGNSGGAIEVVVPRNGVVLKSFGTH
jgi:hypothetical protein